MLSTRRFRRTAALIAAGLVTSVVPLIGAAPPAAAVDGCLSEVPTGSFVTTVCDDVSQPETVITRVQPDPNGKNYINVDHVTYTFNGSYSDADSDAIAYECQFYLSTNPPADWTACTSPVTYDNLADVGPRDPVPYTFRVRAFDSADKPIDAANNSTACPQFTCTPAATDVVDYDESPDSRTLRIDTHAPDTFIFNAPPVDENGGTYPMSTSRTVQLRLNSTEGTDSDPLRFTCRLNDASVPCAEGITTLKNLSPGNKRFTAAATDLAGNTDPSPAQVKFSVPRNLEKARGWVTHNSGGYFAGDYIESKKIGAQVTAPGKNVRELLLIAPGGPELGKVEVKIGNSIWRTVNLKAAKYTRFKIYTVRTLSDPLVSGKIRIRVKSLATPRTTVRIDAILAH